MRKGKSDSIRGDVEIQSDFMLSNLKLGLLENEVFCESKERKLKLIVFNKLDLILKLNNKLIAN